MPRNAQDKEFVPLREAVRLTGLEPGTLRSWVQKDRIQCYETPTHQILYHTESLQRLTQGGMSLESEKKNIIYCRVSSKKQLPDLDRQIELLRSLYPTHELVTDCASGINFARKGLDAILEYAVHGSLKELVVAHRDRLCRFGFELIDVIVTKSGGRIVVPDDQERKSSEQELAEDLLAIVHIWSSALSRGDGMHLRVSLSAFCSILR